LEASNIFKHRYYYEPKKLVTLASDLKIRVSSHTISGDDNLVYMVNKINSMSYENSMIYQSSLKYSVIKEILDYVNNNHEKYSSRNFFHIIDNRYRASINTIMYHALQNNFDNNVFKGILKERLIKIPEKVLVETEVIDFLMTKDLSEKKIYVFFFREGSSLLRIIKENDVRLKSKLHTNLVNGLLMYGNKKDFENLDQFYVEEQSLLLKANSFTTYLNNYFNHYTLNNSRLDYISCITEEYGNPYKRHPHYMWKNVDEDIKLKIRKMINKITIHNAFGKDERSRYWVSKSENMDDVVHSPVNDIIIMYFKSTVVVEYTKVGNAAYFYDVDFFESQFKKVLKHIDADLVIKKDALKEKKYDRAFSQYRLERGQYDHKEPNNTVNHNRNWQRKMNRYLELKGVNT